MGGHNFLLDISVVLGVGLNSSIMLTVIHSSTFQTPAVSNLTETPGTLTIDTLTACNAYWVKVTGVTCGRLANSMPWYVPVLSNSTYEATVFLVPGQTCDTWVTDDRQAQISSWIVNRILRGSTCGFQDVNCIVNTNLSCTIDTDRVTLR